MMIVLPYVVEFRYGNHISLSPDCGYFKVVQAEGCKFAELKFQCFAPWSISSEQIRSRSDAFPGFKRFNADEIHLVKIPQRSYA